MFVLNGYEDLDTFREMEECELDYLGITDSEQRCNIMTAIELLQDYTCNYKLSFLRILIITLRLLRTL